MHSVRSCFIFCTSIKIESMVVGILAVFYGPNYAVISKEKIKESDFLYITSILYLIFTLAMLIL